jgi:lipoprotein-releasing system permease protein
LLLSLSGVVFGVAIFICTQAQTQGFSSYFIESTIGSNGALVMASRFRPRYEPLMVSAKGFKERVGRRLYFQGITNANEIMRVSRQFSNVVSCSPVLRGTVSARAGFENATVDLFGIDPALHAQTTDIQQKLIAGNYDDFRNNTSSIIIGSRLAELLEAGVGDTVQLLAPNGEYWRFTVAAIARAGIGPIDSTRVYTHSRIAQALLQQPSGASIIIYKLRNPDRAPALAEHFETLFQHSATSWQDREESTLQLFLTLRMSVAITTSLIILLAGFGIFNVLTMSVLAKIKEIAILRSMGYRRIDIS